MASSLKLAMSFRKRRIRVYLQLISKVIIQIMHYSDALMPKECPFIVDDR